MKLYIEILKKQFEQRRKKNPQYSLRAFSIQAGLKPGRMSDMFNNRYGLSKPYAIKIANNLNFSTYETKQFLLSVEAYHARDKASRELAEKKLHHLSNLDADVKLENDQFLYIKDWYHFSIIELLKRDPLISEELIAKKLGLSPYNVTEAITRLKKLNLIDEKNNLIIKDALISIDTKKSSEAIKEHHLQILKKTEAALTEQPIEGREFSSCQLLINKNNLNKIKKRLVTFRRQLIKDFATTEDESQLYSFSYQLIALEKVIDNDV